MDRRHLKETTKKEETSKNTIMIKDFVHPSLNVESKFGRKYSKRKNVIQNWFPSQVNLFGCNDGLLLKSREINSHPNVCIHD